MKPTERAKPNESFLDDVAMHDRRGRVAHLPLTQDPISPYFPLHIRKRTAPTYYISHSHLAPPASARLLRRARFLSAVHSTVGGGGRSEVAR